jgi:hypothetical protein
VLLSKPFERLLASGAAAGQFGKRAAGHNIHHTVEPGFTYEQPFYDSLYGAYRKSPLCRFFQKHLVL